MSEVPVNKLGSHVFVCTNERAPGHPRGCCAERGAASVLQKFKAEVVKRNLKTAVRAQRAGCLDTCEHGVSVVVYPEGVWYGSVTEGDVPKIVEEHIVGGKPVASLLLPGK